MKFFNKGDRVMITGGSSSDWIGLTATVVRSYSPAESYDDDANTLIELDSHLKRPDGYNDTMTFKWPTSKLRLIPVPTHESTRATFSTLARAAQALNLTDELEKIIKLAQNIADLEGETK